MQTHTNDLNTSTTERTNIAGVFSNCAKAEQAILDLRAAGFSDDQIGVARCENGQIREFETSATSTERMGEQREERGMWDKIKSAFIGSESDETRDRGAIREDVTNSTGTVDSNAGYASGKDLPQHLSMAGLSEREARYFASRLRDGSCLVTVNTSGSRTSQAIAIMERNDADLGSDAATFETLGGNVENDVATGRGEQRIQLLGEMLRVHKERVNTGEVRMRKEVVTEDRTVQVPVTREELVIERTNVSGDVPADTGIGGDNEIRVPLSEEQVRVDKQSVVTGEVRVGKRQVTDMRNVSDTVRHEEVRIDKEGDIDVDDNERDRKNVA